MTCRPDSFHRLLHRDVSTSTVSRHTSLWKHFAGNVFASAKNERPKRCVMTRANYPWMRLQQNREKETYLFAVGEVPISSLLSIIRNHRFIWKPRTAFRTLRPWGHGVMAGKLLQYAGAMRAASLRILLPLDKMRNLGTFPHISDGNVIAIPLRWRSEHNTTFRAPRHSEGWQVWILYYCAATDYCVRFAFIIAECFSTEYGSSSFIRNISIFPPDYMASLPTCSP